MRPGPIARITEAIRTGERSATQVVTASIDRLAAVNPTLNVLAEAAYDDALATAARLDASGRREGALLGAPTLVKDLEDWVGHPTRMGSLLFENVAPATTNGVTPQRILDAGAIVLGKSTLPEFAIEGYTTNELTGVTHNPWNPDLSTGGSSGGSAAALSSGLVAIATATDGGGSVRIPASLCGLVGLKPTNGAIGRYPEPDWIDYSTDGPFATAADDLDLLY
ncbi:MAG: amidase, partial [Actinomycetota bacterium]|nr:amidase [Actinomycetota bacterium]